MFEVHPMIETEIEGENAPRTGKMGRITLARSEIVGVIQIVDWAGYRGDTVFGWR